jgi:hypothetical protein
VPAVIARLSLMMFLQFGVIGAWTSVLAPYLDELGFEPIDVAWIFSTSAIGSIVAPFIWSQIADRWVSAERCISLCAALAGVLLWWSAQMREPGELFWAILGFWMFMMPVLSLAPTVAFRHIVHPERHYGHIRMWGTVGWMAAGWVLTLWLHVAGRFTSYHTPGLADSLRWGAILAWALSVYAWTLPPTPPLSSETEHVGFFGILLRCIDAPLAAMTLFRVRAFVVYLICFFGCYVSWPFNMQMTSLLIKSKGIADKELPMLLTIAQSTEAITLGALPFILRRLGQRRTQIVGITSWSLALVVLTISRPTLLLVMSLLLHGFYITCFLVAGQVFVNRIAQHHYRASAQGLLVIVNGLGLLLGNILVGWIRKEVDDDYCRAFFPAAVGIAILAGFFIAGFWPRSEPAQIVPATDEPRVE